MLGSRYDFQSKMVSKSDRKKADRKSEDWKRERRKRRRQREQEKDNRYGAAKTGAGS